jgi:hypothetical protein
MIPLMVSYLRPKRDQAVLMGNISEKNWSNSFAVHAVHPCAISLLWHPLVCTPGQWPTLAF